MNITYHTAHVDVTPALLASVDEAVREGLFAMGVTAPERLDVELRHVAHGEGNGCLVAVAITAPAGTLRAEGSGPAPAEAVAVMRHALLRQARSWKRQHARGSRPAPWSARAKGGPTPNRTYGEANRFAVRSRNQKGT